MLTIEYKKDFLKKISHIRDSLLKEKIKKQIEKVIDAPTNGKPMRYIRKNTREVNIPSFRLAYAYISQEEKIIFLEFYHKDK